MRGDGVMLARSMVVQLVGQTGGSTTRRLLCPPTARAPRSPASRNCLRIRARECCCAGSHPRRSHRRPHTVPRDFFFFLAGGTYGSALSIRDAYRESGGRPRTCVVNAGSV